MSFRPACRPCGQRPAHGFAPNPHAPVGCVVTGIAGGAGEEQAALAIARALRAQGLSVAVMTPAITGERRASGCWTSPRLQRLAAAGTFRLPESALCPYRLPPAPDLATAAARGGVVIDPEVVADAREVLATWVDALVVMGVGGLCARLGPALLAGQMLARLALPLVLVRDVGAGCEASALHGAHVAGWVQAAAPVGSAAAHGGVEGSAGAPRLGSLRAVEPGALLRALRGGVPP